jgi:hypothetical protein
MLYDPSLGGWATQTYVFAGMTSKHSYVAEAYGVGERTFTNFINDENTQWGTFHTTDHQPGDGDIGVITLNAPIGNRTSWFGLVPNDLNTFAGATLNTIGYPDAGYANPNSWDNGYNQWAQSGPIIGTPLPGFTFDALIYSQSDIYTEPGQSGSPLFNNAGIIGVHESGNSTWGYAEAVTSDVFNALETNLQADASGSGGSDSRQNAMVASNPVLLKTETTVQVSPLNAVSYGLPVMFTANVSAPGAPAPTTGTVTFYDNGTALGTVQLEVAAQAYAQFTTSTLAPGSHTITAVYNGGGDFQGSTSAAITTTVTAANTFVGLRSSTSAATAGQPVTFTVHVEGSSIPYPTGTVTFYDGVAVLGTAQLSYYLDDISSASFTTSALAVGSHSIMAVYGGDGTYPSGASQPLTVQITPAAVSQPEPPPPPPAPPLPVAVLLVTHHVGKHNVLMGEVLFSDGSLLPDIAVPFQQPNYQRIAAVLANVNAADGTFDLLFTARNGKKTVSRIMPL